MEIEFTHKGIRYRLSREQVIRKLRGVTPERVHSHAVEIERTLYPVKQVFSQAIGLDRLDFTTAEARSVLQRLGFAVRRVT